MEIGYGVLQLGRVKTIEQAGKLAELFGGLAGLVAVGQNINGVRVLDKGCEAVIMAVVDNQTFTVFGGDGRYEKVSGRVLF